jgi:hypothetical protein
LDSTRYLIGRFLGELSVASRNLFCMTLQQDPFEPDRWWFAPLLYAGAALMIAAIVLA